MRKKAMIGLMGAAGLLAGVAAGRHFSGRETSGEASQRVEESRRAERRPGTARIVASSGSPERGVGPLLRTIRRYYAEGDPAIVREIGRLGTPELRDLVGDLMEALPGYPSGERQELSSLVEAALKEWYRREGEKALRQVEAMEGEDTRKMLLSRMILIAARETPGLAKAWDRRYREEWGSPSFDLVAHEAARGAVERSAEDFLKVKELFGAERGISVLRYGAFAEDFDFGKLIAEMPVGHGAENAMYLWAVKDPEAAWEAAREIIGEHGLRVGRYMGDVFQGISVAKGDTEAAAWLAEHIGEVPEEVRRSVFESLWSVDFLTPERSTTVMKALSGRDGLLFASALLDPHGDRGMGVAGLRALNSETDRVEALMSTARKYAPGMHNGPPDHFDKVHGYFDRTMEELGLPAETRERVKAALEP